MQGGVDALGDVHHVVEIGVGLIELDRGKLGVVLGVHALVAEDTTDLVDAVHAADDQALEGKLGRDAHVHVDIERIVVGNERPRGAPPAMVLRTGGSRPQCSPCCRDNRADA